MKKIPCVFVCSEPGHRATPIVNPGCEWVLCLESALAQRRIVGVTKAVIDLPNRSRVTVDLAPKGD